jgi:hypothetical protein
MKRLELRKNWYLVFTVLVLGVFASCSQDEGTGGNSHIKGKLVKKVYSEDLSVLLDELPAKDERVYLVYGEGNIPDVDVRTGYEGDFQFQYLWPGKYKIYYYSQDTSSAVNEQVERVVEIDLKKNETVDLENLSLVSVSEWDEGSATIKGKVTVTNFKNSSVYPNMEVKDVTPAQEYDVYLVYGNNSGYNERIRTGYDGTFAFRNCIKGKYKIYVYSEDIKGGTAQIPVIREAEVTETEQVIDLETMYVDKL